MKDNTTKNRTLLVVGSSIAVLFASRYAYKMYLHFYRKKYLDHLNFMNKILRAINEKNQPDNHSIIHLKITRSQDITIENRDKQQHSLLICQSAKLEEKQKMPKLNKNNCFLPPFEPGIYLADLGKTHRLLMNKYMLVDRHVLVITKIFEAQFIELSEADLGYSYAIASILDGFVFYNSGKRAGASQKHKHLQVVPYSSLNYFYLNKVKETVQASDKHTIKDVNGISFLEFPYYDKYKYVLMKFKPIDKNTQDIEEYAVELKKVYKKGIQELNNEKANQSYNLMYGMDWMLIVPRKSEKFLNRISLNAFGCLGSVLVKSDEEFKLCIDKTPEDILDEILVSKNDTNEYYSCLDY